MLYTSNITILNLLVKEFLKKQKLEKMPQKIIMSQESPTYFIENLYLRPFYESNLCTAWNEFSQQTIKTIEEICFKTMMKLKKMFR